MGELFNWGGESPEQRAMRSRMEMEALYEQAARLAQVRANSAQAGGKQVEIPFWISVTNTAYLYPKSDLREALAVTNQPYTKDGNRYVFASLVELDLFYYDVWYRTSLSQPVNNLGYSLAVGTELEGSFDEIHLDLENGTRIITLQLMRQITSQSELPNGGDSPDGTVGYGAVYSDVNGDGVPGTISELGAGNLDPLRFQRTN